MNKKSDNYDEYIKKLTIGAQQLPAMLPDILSTLFVKPPTDAKEQIKTVTGDVLEMLTAVAPDFSNLINMKDSKERNKAIINLAESELKPLIKIIPPEKKLIDFLIEYFDTSTPLPAGNFLMETSYPKYTNTISSLSKDFVAIVPINKRSEFLDSVFTSEKDVFSMGQSILTEYSKMYKELSAPRKRFTKKQAMRDMEYYGTLAGHFEKSISTVAGVIKCINGENVTYEIMRRHQLAGNLKIVNESKYSLLTTGFNKNIRNALAHKQIVVNAQQRNITFYDPISRISIDLTYKEINENTKELCALFITTQRLPMQIWSDTFSKLKNSV